MLRAEYVAADAAELSSPAKSDGASLRPHQQRVADDFWIWWTRPDRGEPRQWGRIVLPPRSGKTVVAAWVLEAVAVEAVFVVPTRTLVTQTERELKRWLHVPVGVYSGEHKDIVSGGVNVTTYSMLQSFGDPSAWPEPLRRAKLVILDEAHHAMTTARVALLGNGFAPEAARLALTATPDYDESRTLCRFFPDLVHEITIEEALDEGLLAPLRLWVAEVDAKGSEVRIVQGEYDWETLGRVMSTAPFARAVAAVRYSKGNERVPALIACASRQQAHDIGSFLDDHRPSARPRPCVLLGITPREERERILADFETGRIDTIVQVGVLLEGWNSPSCKLLIDLAPSLSQVRATQKYFRVMTRHAEEEARIYILLPSELPGLPVLPTELFGSSLREYESGMLLGKANVDVARPTPLLLNVPNLEGVRVLGRIVHRASLEKPLLGRDDREGTLRVLKSCPGFSFANPPGPRAFVALRFEHALFVGNGYQLLRWMKHPPTTAGYTRFLYWVLDPLNREHLELTQQELASSRNDVRHLIRAIRSGLGASVDLAAGSRTLGGRDPDDHNPEEVLLRREEAHILSAALGVLKPRHRRVVCQHFGLCGQRARSSAEISELEMRSRMRIQDLLNASLRKLRFFVVVPQHSGSSYRDCLELAPERTLRMLRDRKIPFLGALPPPNLYPPSRRRRGRHIGDEFETWSHLPSKLPWSALIASCEQLLAILGVPATFAPEPLNVLSEATLDSRSNRAIPDQAWLGRAGAVELYVERFDYAWLDGAGEEQLGAELLADLGPFGHDAHLYLTGTQGYIEAFRIDAAIDASTACAVRHWLDGVEQL